MRENFRGGRPIRGKKALEDIKYRLPGEVKRIQPTMRSRGGRAAPYGMKRRGGEGEQN